MTEHAALEVNEVTKHFGSVKALNRLSLHVPTGSIFGLVGPNGAGKTTLFSIIAGFLRLDCGEVRALGMDARRLSKLQGRMSIGALVGQWTKLAEGCRVVASLVSGQPLVVPRPRRCGERNQDDHGTDDAFHDDPPTVTP